MMEAQPKAKGGAEPDVGRRGNAGLEKTHITFSDAGIDKNLANRARQLNALSQNDFENLVSEGREDAQRGVELLACSRKIRQ